MTATIPERLVGRLSRFRGPDRRGFLRGAAVVGAAVVTSPWDFLVRPASAYDAVCGANNTCAEGYSVFCCTVNNGQNTCPPDSFIGGWWKADQSSFCGGSARYYIDCNAFRDGHYQCRCNTTTCDQRLVACNQFRYGQCSPEIPYSQTGPVVCRLVSCTPPWQQFAGTCSTASATDNNTATHSAPCNNGNAPIGHLDEITSTGHTVRLRGWSIDPDGPSTPLSVAVYEDGVGLSWYPSNVARPDVNAAYGTTGNHGFDITVQSASGPHRFQVYAIGVGAGAANTRIADTTLVVNPGANPVGHVDTLTSTGNTLHLAGWAYDPDSPTTEIVIDVYLDGVGLAEIPTGRPRPDVDAAFGITGAHGFQKDFTVASGPHSVGVFAINVAGGDSTLLLATTLVVNPGALPVGVLDDAVVTASGVRLTGWAFDPDRPATSLQVAVYEDSHGISWFPADKPRPDVDRGYGITGAHGFDITVPSGAGTHRFDVFGINIGGGAVNPLLASRTVTVPAPVGTGS